MHSSNPVAPTIFRNKPFGEYVEGLSHCEDASYRSTSVFKWNYTKVELTGEVTELLCLLGETVVQIPSPVLAVADRCFETELLRQFVRPTSRNRRKQTTHSFALARLGRHWEVFLKPRVPERGLVGGGFGRLIAVKVDIQPNHDRAAAVDGSKGGYGWPRLVEP